MNVKDLTALFKLFATIGITVVGVSAFATPSRAGLSYDEGINAPGGDLSNDRLNPTFIGQLTSGKNSLTFKLDNPLTLPEIGIFRTNRDLDYFYVTIPDKFMLSQLILATYDPTFGGTVSPGSDQIAFIGLQNGTQLTEPAQPGECPTLGETNCGTDAEPRITIAAKLLGYTLVGTESAAINFAGINIPQDDLLPSLGATIRPNQPNGLTSPIPNNGLGFLPPLTPGNYVFWAQQTAPGKVTIKLDFLVSPIPEPSSSMALLALGGLGVFSLVKRKK